MSTERSVGFGRGKAILFGEHAVVYSQPAIVGSLSKGVKVSLEESSEWSFDIQSYRETDFPESELLKEATRAMASVFELESAFDVEIDNQIPVGVGLGASAAYSYALSNALAELTGNEARLLDAANEGERVFHGRPSGVDLKAASSEGFFFFHPGQQTETAPLDCSPVHLRLGWQPDIRSPTADLLNRVAKLKHEETQLVERLLQWIGDLSRAAAGAFRSCEMERIGRLMNMNHGTLDALGVVGERADRACRQAREAGALGAKVTGAGGEGAVVALLDASDTLDAFWKNQSDFDALDVTL